MITIKGKEYKVIDAHLHAWDRFDGFRDGGVKIEPLGFGMVREGDITYRFLPPEYKDHQVPIEIALAHMNENGIDKGVLLQNPCYGDQRDYLKEVQKNNPGRFVVLGLIDPRNPEEVVRQMEELTKNYGVVGFKIEVPDVPFLLDESDFLWEKILDLDAVVALDLGWRDGPFNYNIDRFENVMKKYPKMKTVLCHLGVSKLSDLSQQYPFPLMQKTLSLLEINKDNLYFDFSGMQGTEPEADYPWPRSLSYLKAVKEHWGLDRVMWGSDMPMILRYCTYRETLTCYTNHCDFLSSEDYEKILYSNAEHIYFSK